MYCGGAVNDDQRMQSRTREAGGRGTQRGRKIIGKGYFMVFLYLLVASCSS